MSAVLSQITRTDELTAEARHELLIPAAVAEVFEMTRNVLRWSEYMPAVTEAEFVSELTNGDVVQITAEANDQKHTWRSRRTIDTTQWTIDFERIGPVEPLVDMRGTWSFVPMGTETRAILTHRYTTTSHEALTFFDNATRSNATRDLEGLAEFFGRKEENQ